MEKIKEWHWEITKKCNLRCRHCLSECGKPSLKELNVEEAVKTIGLIKNLGCQRIMLTGGEPMCYQGFRTILEECKDQGISVNFITNGVLLTAEMAEEISDLIEGAAVSIDGSKQGTNDYLRGVGVFEIATNAVRLLAKIVPISVFVTASNYNLNEVKNIIELSWSLGATYVHVSEVNILGRALSCREMFVLSPDQKLQLRNLASDMTGVFPPIKNCDVDFSVLYISSDGLIYPCVEVALRSPKSFLGDVRNDNIREDLLRAMNFFEGEKKTKCCYELFTGNKLVFCLNAQDKCCLAERR